MSIQPLPSGALLRRQSDGTYRYRIKRVLGVGGFAITYQAEDTMLMSEVAIKEFALDGFVYRRSTNTSLDAVHGKEVEVARWMEKFVTESRRISAFRHPGIIRVTDVWADENQTAYYTMELIEGIELPSYGWDENPETPLELQEVQRIGLRLLDALDTVHQGRIVHCDIKPSNVLIDRRRDVFLIDFGAARADNELRKTVTSNAYTPVYAPPELQDRRRLAEIGPWSDLYSWAATVVSCIVPLPASGGVGIDAVTRKIVWDTSGTDPWNGLWVQLERSDLPTVWVRMLRECLAISPSERPNSAAVVYHSLSNRLSRDSELQAPLSETLTKPSQPVPNSGKHGLHPVATTMYDSRPGTSLERPSNTPYPGEISSTDTSVSNEHSWRETAHRIVTRTLDFVKVVIGISLISFLALILMSIVFALLTR